MNERTRETIIIDPGKVTLSMIDQLETHGAKLVAIFVTHNHGSHVHGIKTLTKIYNPRIYGADIGIMDNQTFVLTGDGKVHVAGFTVYYTSIPGHTIDSMVYKIGNVLFTGDSISAGLIGKTASSYSSSILQSNIKHKILSQSENTIIMPGHGPPSTVGAEREFNSDMEYKDSDVDLFSFLERNNIEETESESE